MQSNLRHGLLACQGVPISFQLYGCNLQVILLHNRYYVVHYKVSNIIPTNLIIKTCDLICVYIIDLSKELCDVRSHNMVASICKHIFLNSNFYSLFSFSCKVI